MLDLWGAQGPHGWVVGDDELERLTRFCHELRERGERYVLGVPCNTTMRDLEAPLPAYQGRGRRPKPPWQSVTAWRTSLDLDGWTRLTVREGEKGPVEIEMVKRRVQTRLERKRTGPHEWLVVTRRPLADAGTLEAQASWDATDQDAHYRYQYYLTPTQAHASKLEEPSLAELARVSKAGVCVETSFKRGKSEAGMDAYQVRIWEGWHHHMVLALIAVWFLIVETHQGQQLTPALPLPQVRYRLSVLLMEVFCTLSIPYSVAKCTANECATSWLDFTTIVPVTVYHQGSYVETYSRSTGMPFLALPRMWHKVFSFKDFVSGQPLTAPVG